jgi:hypothetical protein
MEMNENKHEKGEGLSFPRLAALAFCAGLGMLIVAFFAGYTAKADTPTEQEYIISNGQSVCHIWEEAGISTEVIGSMGRRLVQNGWTAKEAASIMWESTDLWCDKYLPTLSNVVLASVPDKPSTVTTTLNRAE